MSLTVPIEPGPADSQRKEDPAPPTLEEEAREGPRTTAHHPTCSWIPFPVRPRAHRIEARGAGTPVGQDRVLLSFRPALFCSGI